jgi:hypothetical protein
MNFKEVVDNALDTDVDAVLDQIGPDTWLVTDDGPGLDRRQVVRLSAVNRPMTSTKPVRRPTRGAIGNGLRVVTAASWRVVVGSSSKAAVLLRPRAVGRVQFVEVSGSFHRPSR